MHKYKEMKFMTLSLQAGIKYFSFIYIALIRKKKPYRALQVNIPVVINRLMYVYDRCLILNLFL